MKISVDRASVKSAEIFRAIEYVDNLRSLSTRNYHIRNKIASTIVALEDLIGALAEVDPNLFRESSRLNLPVP